MNKDELRSIAEDEKRRQEAEHKRISELHEAKVSEANWAKARDAVERVSDALAQAASGGLREAIVYSISSNQVGSWQVKTGFWGTKTKTVYNIPDYARYVFDECQKAGRNPQWHRTGGSASGGGYVPVGRWDVVISW